MKFDFEITTKNEYGDTELTFCYRVKKVDDRNYQLYVHEKGNFSDYAIYSEDKKTLGEAFARALDICLLNPELIPRKSDGVGPTQ